MLHAINSSSLKLNLPDEHPVKKVTFYNSFLLLGSIGADPPNGMSIRRRTDRIRRP